MPISIDTTNQTFCPRMLVVQSYLVGGKKMRINGIFITLRWSPTQCQTFSRRQLAAVLWCSDTYLALVWVMVSRWSNERIYTMPDASIMLLKHTIIPLILMELLIAGRQTDKQAIVLNTHSLTKQFRC